MNIRLLIAAAAAFVIAAIAGTGGALAVNDSSNGADNGIHDTRGVAYFNCDDDTVASEQPTDANYLKYEGPISIWPPNHKLRTWTITAVDGNGADGPVSLSVVTTSDEPVDGVGDGNTDNDWTDPVAAGGDAAPGEAALTGKVRGERSGTGDGRTYSFATTAGFDDDPSCTHNFTANVPHDQGKRKKPTSATSTKLSRVRLAF